MISGRLVRVLGAPGPSWTRRRKGKVTAVSTGPPVTVTVLLSDGLVVSPPFPGTPVWPGTPASNLVCDAAYAAAPPQVGDLVYILQSGPNWTVLGSTPPP